MKRIVFFFLALVAFTFVGRAQDYADHRSKQWGMYGNDFWLCAPSTNQSLSATTSTLAVVALHDCSVTVEIEQLGFSHTFPVISHTTINNRMDTINRYEIPYEIFNYIDSLYAAPSPSQLPIPLAQNKGIHVTSTDTIQLSLIIYGLGSTEVVPILPTPLLRDEYVIQSYPNAAGSGKGFIDVVATEDSTIVDVVLSDEDLVGHQAGDSLSVLLHRGQMFHLRARRLYEPPIDTQWFTNEYGHSFTGHGAVCREPHCDISGTRVKARDCKRIAVLEGNNAILCPDPSASIGTGNSDIGLEMAIPLSFAGTTYLVPNLDFSDTDYLRFIALEDSTVITITDNSRYSNRVRTRRLSAYQPYWFQMEEDEGPFYITSNHPILLSEHSMGNNEEESRISYGDPAMVIIKPVEWWNSNPIRYHMPFYVDNNGNRYADFFFTHLFARSEDVPYMMIDDYSVSDYFIPIVGTPFSYAHFDRHSQFNSLGHHNIYCTRPGYFMAIGQHVLTAMHSLWTYPHMQPLGSFFTVNDIPAQRLREDSIWCMYDTITFHGRSGLPADSIFWDLGDGTHYAFAYDEGQVIRHVYADTGRYRVRRIITWKPESADGYSWANDCFSIPPDTMYAPIWIHNHYDSTISVRLCEGSYYFRGLEFSYTDTFYHTTYWTASGCDTLWTIDLVTCPHCTYHSDTIAPDQLPWNFNGISFGSMVTDFPVALNIGDTCDSVIYYTLVVLKHWGEPPLDSIIIMAPNVFTPDRDDNNRFFVVSNKFISQMRVWIYNRRGVLIKEFDGVTEDWDGTKDGRPLPQETYVYYIRYMDTEVNGWKTLKGTVTLLR